MIKPLLLALDRGRITAVLSPPIGFVGAPLLAAMFVWQPNPMLLLMGLFVAAQLTAYLASMAYRRHSPVVAAPT